MNLVKDYLCRFDVPDAEGLFLRVKEDSEPMESSNEQSLILGGLWPGNIRIGEPNGDSPTMGIVDREFSGRGRETHVTIAGSP